MVRVKQIYLGGIKNSQYTGSLLRIPLYNIFISTQK